MTESLPGEAAAFLRDSIGEEWTAQPLAGDASYRRYFRIAAPDQSYVLAWYPEEMRAESKRFLDAYRAVSPFAYVPKIIKYYLDQDPLLPNVNTYLASEPKDRAFILENIAFIWKGPRPVSLPPNTLPTSAIFTLGTCPKCATYRWDQLFVLLVTVPVLLGLVWLVRYTKRGKAMRATAQDKDAAAMMGIDVNRTISFTFLVAGALAGAAGVIFTLYGTTIQFNTGFTLGLIAFTAAVLGGIGNLPGAVLGGLLIGFIQDYNEGLSWHAPGSAWTNSIVFGILILILVFRPQGLLGEQTPEGG